MVVVKEIFHIARNTLNLFQNVRKLKSFVIETQFLIVNMPSMGIANFSRQILVHCRRKSTNASKCVKFVIKMNEEKGVF